MSPMVTVSPSSHPKPQKTFINHFRKISTRNNFIFRNPKSRFASLPLLQATLSTLIVNPVFIHTLAKPSCIPVRVFLSSLPSKVFNLQELLHSAYGLFKRISSFFEYEIRPVLTYFRV
jgi:hypothetical protein